MPYKSTLNIPSTAFPMRASLAENAPKYLGLWDKLKIFEKLSTRSGKPFFLHDGPPYANGDIHLGHALNKVLKDFCLRYKALSGCPIRYVPGWDTHGLPIENKLEREGDYRSKSPLKRRRACAEYAKCQVENQKNQFQKLHLLCNFRETYVTMQSDYIVSELLIFLELIKKGLIYRSLKPVAWSWSSGTALAESEIIYKEVKDRSIYFTFGLASAFKDLPDNASFLIWTTTPYTLESNLAIALNPRITYGLYRLGKNHVISGIQPTPDHELIGEYQGEYFKGATYLNPITRETGTVIMADYITGETGTAIVHIAPGFGLDDYLATRDLNLPAYCPISESGYFLGNTKFDPINNLFYEDAINPIIDFLTRKGHLLRVEEIKHKVGHDWRTGKPIIYRASEQWFIEVAFARDHAIEFDSNPPWIQTRLRGLIHGREEWCISRQRSWGTPIPILFSNGKPILDPGQIAHTIELIRENGVDSWYSKDPEFFLSPDLGKIENLKKSMDILDVWFDSGCSWVQFDEGADLYIEGFDQTRGWFNSSAVISLAMHGKLPFRGIISHGFILDNGGNKMSKSLGNVIDPIGIVDKYGADILRLMLASNNHLEDIRLGDNSIDGAISLYRNIRNTLLRYSLSLMQNLRGEPIPMGNLTLPENQYMYELFRVKYEGILGHLENFLFFRAIRSIGDFINLYSSWYLEINKDLLYCGDINSREVREVLSLVREIFSKLVIILSIFIPQTAEEAYQHTGNGLDSVNLETIRPVGKIYEINWGQWDQFFKLKDRVYVEIEKLKGDKLISNSSEVKLSIPGNQVEGLRGFDLRKFLNIAEVEVSGNILKVVRSQLPRCDRCKRHGEIGNGLCGRCDQIVNPNPQA